MNNQNFFTSVRPVRYREILSALITRDATTASVPIRFRVRSTRGRYGRVWSTRIKPTGKEIG